MVGGVRGLSRDVVRLCFPEVTKFGLALTFFFSSLEKRVRDMVHKAFWDSLEAELNDEPAEYEHAIKLLEEIREVTYRSMVKEMYFQLT